MNTEKEALIKVKPLTGKLPEPKMLVNISRPITAYYTEARDPSLINQRAEFGTLGHRGNAFKNTFNDSFILRT